MVTDSGARLSSTPLAPTAPGASEAVAPPWPGSATERRPAGGRRATAAAAGGGRTGTCEAGLCPSRIAVQVAGHVDVGVEPEHRVGLGQLGGELLAVPLGQAADGHDRLGAAAVLEVGGLQQRVDRVLLGLLDEAAGVDHGDVGLGRVVDQQPALGGEPAGQLLGVDLVARHSRGSRGRRCGQHWQGVWSPQSWPHCSWRAVEWPHGRRPHDPRPRDTQLLRRHPLVDGHNDLPWEARTQAGYDFDRLDLSTRLDHHAHRPAPAARGRGRRASSGRSGCPRS